MLVPEHDLSFLDLAQPPLVPLLKVVRLHLVSREPHPAKHSMQTKERQTVSNADKKTFPYHHSTRMTQLFYLQNIISELHLGVELVSPKVIYLQQTIEVCSLDECG